MLRRVELSCVLERVERRGSAMFRPAQNDLPSVTVGSARHVLFP